MIKNIFGSPLESFRNARKPGGFLAPAENFRGFLTSDAANIASKILGGTPIAQAFFEGPIQALQDYAGLVSPIASGLPVSVTNAPSTQPNALAGAFGGGLMGAAAPASFLGGYAPAIGAGLGALGFLS